MIQRNFLGGKGSRDLASGFTEIDLRAPSNRGKGFEPARGWELRRRRMLHSKYCMTLFCLVPGCSLPDAPSLAIRDAAVSDSASCDAAALDAPCGECGKQSCENGRLKCSDPGYVKVTQMALGRYHTCALLSTGGVRCWGANESLQLGYAQAISQPPSKDVLTGVESIAAGTNHNCALLINGDLKCWGDNGSGQLGTSNAGSNSLVPGLALEQAQKAVAGFDHTCALLVNGSVKCWGGNSDGQLGNGSANPSASPPVSAILTDVICIDARDYRTCAILSGHGLSCWGAGQKTPAEPGQLTEVDQVSVGNGSTCVLRHDGGVRCWVLGAVPPLTDLLTGVSMIATGGSSPTDHWCAISKTNGEVRCWGNNQYGQLGDGTVVERQSPGPALFTGAIGIAAGERHACAVLQNGAARCWGDNSSGQVGDGYSGSGVQRSKPTAVIGLDGRACP
jgi:hypothetical protein